MSEETATDVVTEETSVFSAQDEATRTESRNNSDFIQSIPEEYRNKPYLENVNSMSDLIRDFDNAQQLIGKRPSGIPQESASPEEWGKFYDTMGRPSDFNGYETPEIDIPEDQKETLGKVIEEYRSKEMEDFMKQSCHKHGITNKQYKALAKDFNDHTIGHITQTLEAELNAEKELHEEFDKLGTELYGDKLDSVVERGSKFIEKYTPEKYKQYLSGQDNHFLIGVMATLDNMHKAYGEPDTVRTEGTNTTVISTSEKESLRKKYIADPAWSNQLDPRHKEIREKWSALYT